MAFKIKPIEVWAGDIQNRPGMLARVLEALTAAGASLEFMIARRVSEHTSRVFVSPLKAGKQRQAALDVGLSKATGMHTLCIEGPDRKGLGAELTRAVAAKGINLRGASAASLGRKVRFYLAFSTPADMRNAAAALRKALR